MTAVPPTVEAIAAELRAIAALLGEARRLLGEDHMVPLTDLEQRTRAACEAASALPREQGRSLRADLEAVLYDLDSLATELTDRYGPQARRDGAGGTRPHRTLAAAYRPDAPRGADTDQET